ncbi:MAG: sulfite exporter TauE/SafE family protein [Candidatus Omnitrophica bacterium]|nr:sulfite exporter TauE/SafE family protein [Candidatus Omnitrophota bacterium]
MNLSGNIIDLVKVFFAGVAVSFTPCLYPLIPVTASFIGASSSGSKAKGFSLSLVYVTGIALTYSILGLMASLTGMFFGRISSHPATYIIVGIIIVIFGLSMLNLFALYLPHFFRPPVIRKRGYFSTFVLGLSSGLVASPCLTPVLGTILFYLTTKTNIVYGATLLFTFAFGMGTLLIVVGTFSSIIVNLPKSGRWLDYIQKIGAIVLISIGLYFVYTGIRRM